MAQTWDEKGNAVQSWDEHGKPITGPSVDPLSQQTQAAATAGGAPATPAPQPLSGSMNKVGLVGENISPEQEDRINANAAHARSNAITPVTDATMGIMPVAGAMGSGPLTTQGIKKLAGVLTRGAVGAAGGSAAGGYGGRAIGKMVGAPEAGEQIGATVGGLAGGYIGANTAEPTPEPATPEQTLATAVKEKRANYLPSRVKTNQPVKPTFDMTPGSSPSESAISLDDLLHKNDAAVASPRPATSIEDEVNASRVKESNPIDPEWFNSLTAQTPEEPPAGPPPKPGLQKSGVGLYPEPREPLPEDKPGVMYSVKRGTILPQSAERGAPGAGDVLKNIGKPILYTPREGVGYPGPRSESIGTPIGEPTPQTGLRSPSSSPEDVVKQAGAKFVGIQKGYGVRPDMVLFQPGDNGTTLSVDVDKLSPQAILDKIKANPVK